ncbi:MAG: PQQ-binding-like beta-propeller repeat protein, partial [Candidatus Aenigmarchaeota archaeon]|nr:PQQ-binding-like beta-propeller repeat protein [Candidatus Aenigmarchaeota archaeon]
MDFDQAGFSDFDLELEDFEVRKTKKFERVWNVGEGGSIVLSVLDGDVVYFGACDGNVYAISADTGREIWRFKTDAPAWGTPCIHGDMLFIGSYDHNLYAL